ncbi:PTS mannitol transporter subunit IICB [Virgibacillus doumboii]|uniref:PTS mannitol transporter subunit IICB n=1 Tax=Virgibacillus doumboii TaxID=2697503 RepID=UPI0013DE911D|nr:PTS mannitol transporter subunit IICB [Virgibacillus doumboii]
MKKFARLLSAMVYQNIIIIIAVGVIRVIFGDYGWWYNETITEIVNPVYHTLLPVLIAYTGGKLVGGQRGATVAAIAVFGLTLSSTVPAILGAMIIGPLLGWVMKKVDQLMIKRLPGVGYELLIGNVLASFIAIISTLFCFLYVGELFSAGVEFSLNFLESIVNSSLLPLAAIIVEPAKVLFFNNIINFGMLAPLGIHQVNELGKSIFFLIESNPGPGLGILIAYWLKTKGEQRKGAKIATSIHFFGGIHEVYFPYVLMKPRLIIPLILGGMAGIFSFQSFNVGLVAISSPGSIFPVVGLAPKEDMIFVLLGVLLSALVSFIGSYFLLENVSDSPSVKDTKDTINDFYQVTESGSLPTRGESRFEKAEQMNEQATMELKGTTIDSIYFVCEAGIGSSAMGAAMLRKRLQEANLDISVVNSSIDDISPSADLIICHERLLPTVKRIAPDTNYYPLQTFTDMKDYKELVERLV